MHFLHRQSSRTVLVVFGHEGTHKVGLFQGPRGSILARIQNQKSSSSSSIVALPLVSCGVPSGFITSHITKYRISIWVLGRLLLASIRNRMNCRQPGLSRNRRNSMGHSSRLPLKSLLTIVLLLMLCVGSFPSSQMYSNFALFNIGITPVPMKTVYYTIAQFLFVFLLHWCINLAF